MPEHSATADLVELARRFFDSIDRGDLDSMMSFCAPNGVVKLTGMGTSFEGVPAIRGFFEDWFAAHEELAVEPEEIHDLGSGVTFGVVLQKGRPVGSSGHVQMRTGAMSVRASGVQAQSRLFTDIAEARAAAERFAESRG